MMDLRDQLELLRNTMQNIHAIYCGNKNKDHKGMLTVAFTQLALMECALEEEITENLHQQEKQNEKL